jgi:hypothetical protein
MIASLAALMGQGDEARAEWRVVGKLKAKFANSRWGQRRMVEGIKRDLNLIAVHPQDKALWALLLDSALAQPKSWRVSRSDTNPHHVFRLERREAKAQPPGGGLLHLDVKMAPEAPMVLSETKAVENDTQTTKIRHIYQVMQGFVEARRTATDDGRTRGKKLSYRKLSSEERQEISEEQYRDLVMGLPERLSSGGSK